MGIISCGLRQPNRQSDHSLKSIAATTMHVAVSMQQSSFGNRDNFATVTLPSTATACHEILQCSWEQATGPDHDRSGDDLQKLQQTAAMPTEIAHVSAILLSPPTLLHTRTTDNRNADRSGQFPYTVLFTTLLLLHVIKKLLYKEGHTKLQYRQNRLIAGNPFCSLLHLTCYPNVSMTTAIEEMTQLLRR